MRIPKTPSSFIFLALMVIGIPVVFIACKKENLTRNIIGVYSGSSVAKQKERDYRDTTFTESQVQITRIDEKKITVILMLDKNKPAQKIELDCEAQDENNFTGSKGAPRNYSINVSGKITGNQLDYSYSYNLLGYYEKIDFKGSR